ncbi:hypothetical protein ACFL0Y_02520 [Patescibacteria group bacterium]
MRKNLISIIFVLALLFLISSSVFAAPARPRYGVNEQAKECSEFFMGDECVSCAMPEGWQMIDESQCPAGYDEVETRSVCTPRKNTFCCTVQHSGARGDCEDVIVNGAEQKCAFVEDINRCDKLPTGWNRAEEIKSWGRACPSLGYKWLEGTLDCKTKIIDNDYGTDSQNNIINDKQQKSNIFLVLVVAITVIALLIIMWFFLIKRR